MRKKVTLLQLVVTSMFLVLCQTIMGQDAQDSQKALSLVQSNAAAIGLSKQNILDSRISDTYVDALSGNTLVYLQQTYMGIDVDKVIQVLAFKNGTLVSGTGKRIDLNLINVSAVNQQRKAITSSVTAESAIQSAAQHLHLSVPVVSQRPAGKQDFSKITDFGDMGIAKENVTARLLWVPQKSFERVKLVWEVNLSPKKSSDSWRMLIDASTGNLIKKENYTIPDAWNKTGKKENTLEKVNSSYGLSFKKSSDYKNEYKKQPPQGITSVTYRVIPFPTQTISLPKNAPTLVTDPWKLSPTGSGAVPFIWNDDGSKQYKFTRGNNVLAQEDLNGDNGSGKRAKGVINKNDLFFDFVPDFNQQPTDSINQGFAITNLFYWNNIMHDLSYQYGFDEVSGNFQQNNLGRGGKGYDFVFADAQDGSSFDNANFNTPPDGKNPRMQMFLWDGDPTKHMKVNAPSSIAGNVAAIEGDLSPNNLLANIGLVSGDVALYNEASDNLHTACDVPENSAELKGRIVLLSRGTCGFTTKILNAQNAGAIAVIVMDNVPGEAPFIMSAAAPDPTITIPAVMISYEQGTTIMTVLGTGSTVNVSLFPSPFTDGDVDNGVICHEYTHGISTRLTGGPSVASCLFNAEQMGEGWSDYISLMTTTDWHKAKIHDGALPRAIGAYVLNQPPNGPGIRQFPYSTDMTIDPHTYGDVATSGGEVHIIGEIWTSVLWDMTWNIIEQDGINKDIFNANGEGGNSVAYKLVIEGLKLQPCSPGFIDGRDAILKADTLLYNGKYSCAIWRAFARRGMGVGASEGSSDLAGDEIPDFKLGGIIITKHADKKAAAPGDNLNYTIGLRARDVCGGHVKQNYSVTDSLPGNVTYINSDGTFNPGSRTVSFGNIDMENGDSLTFKLKVKVKNRAAFPDSVYINDSINTPVISDKWVAKDGLNLAWSVLNIGFFTYYSNDTSGRDEEALVTAQKYLIPGNKTTFSFFNFFITNDFNNGGVVEITTDEGKTWQDLGPYIELGTIGYTETINGNSVLTGRKAFSGFGMGTTTIDLSSFAGKKVKIRFHYATSDNSLAVSNGGTGWVIGNIVLSASPLITNTANLFNQKNELKGTSTVTTKVKGNNVPSADFVVVKHDAQALLTWHTPVEINNGTYQVERSTDNGVSFKAIGTLNTVSDDAELQPYNFTDVSPAGGINLYRINHVSNTGAIEYSDVRSVIFDNLKGVEIFPNPAKDKIKVYIPGNDKIVTVQLINTLGNQIKTYRTSGQNIELNLPVLAHGVYYLNIIRDGSTSKHKIVIE